MRDIINRFKKPTIFLVGGTLAILYYIPATVYCILQNDSGGAMYVLIYFFYIIFAGAALALDYLLISRILYTKTCFIEAVIVLIAYIGICYERQVATIDISGIKKPYIIVVDNSKGLNINHFRRIGLFDRELKVKDTDEIKINMSSLKNYGISYRVPVTWGTVYSDLHKYNCYLITGLNLTDSKLDSILNSKSLK
jgi:hypothetical protein